MLNQKSEIPDAMNSMNEQIMLRNDNFVQNGSYLQISKIYYVSVAITRFAPLAGSGFRELPEFLDLKRAIINVKNTDNRCFGYAILSALYPNQNNPQREQRYIFHFGDAGLDTISYPVEPSEVPVLEEQLNQKINIFRFMMISKRRDILSMCLSENSIERKSICSIGTDIMHGSKSFLLLFLI